MIGRSVVSPERQARDPEGGRLLLHAPGVGQDELGGRHQPEVLAVAERAGQR